MGRAGAGRGAIQGRGRRGASPGRPRVPYWIWGSDASGAIAPCWGVVALGWSGLSPEHGTVHTRGMADVLCPVVIGRDAELGVLRAALRRGLTVRAA